MNSYKKYPIEERAKFIDNIQTKHVHFNELAEHYATAMEALQIAESEIQELKQEILKLKKTINTKPKLYSNVDIILGISCQNKLDN